MAGMVEKTGTGPTDTFEGYLHRTIKRSVVAWKLVMDYKVHGLEPPSKVLELAADTTISKRTWERVLCEARQELVGALSKPKPQLQAQSESGFDGSA